MMTITNPATGTTLVKLKVDNIDNIKEKWQLSKKAQQSWAALPIAQRLACIERFSLLLELEKEVLAETLSLEVGKPVQQAYNELNGAKARISFFLEHSEKQLAEEWITNEGSTKEKISYEPLGVIANISAWNYPYLVGVNVFVPALIAGNAILYKPSEYASLTGRHIERLMKHAGVPAEIFQTITGDGQAGAALLELPLNGYFFTGSYATGKKIAEAASAKLVPVQLELGGKDPLYVMDDVADVNKVAADALEGVMYNAGQSCCAVERMYVHAKIYEAFLASIVKKAAELKIGDPLDKAVDMGPLCRAQQVKVLEKQVEDAVSKGAHLAFQTQNLPESGAYFPITLLTNVNHTMDIMKDESFGPVVGIQKVESDEEAIELMLDTEYGLTAAVYGTEFERAEKIMRQMDTGTVYFNCCDRVSATLPWSGRGHSGLGSTLSFSGIRVFTKPKAWHIRG